MKAPVLRIDCDEICTGAEFKDIIKCAICFGVVIEPKECKNCNSLFCNECIQEYQKNNSGKGFSLNCPSYMCRKPMLMQPINRMLKNITLERMTFKHTCQKMNFIYEYKEWPSANTEFDDEESEQKVKYSSKRQKKAIEKQELQTKKIKEMMNDVSFETERKKLESHVIMVKEFIWVFEGCKRSHTIYFQPNKTFTSSYLIFLGYWEAIDTKRIILRSI